MVGSKQTQSQAHHCIHQTNSHIRSAICLSTIFLTRIPTALQMMSLRPYIERASGIKRVGRTKTFQIGGERRPLPLTHKVPIAKFTVRETEAGHVFISKCDKPFAIISKDFRKVGPGLEVKLVSM